MKEFKGEKEMNKKLLIGIIAGVLALAVLIAGIVLVTKKIDGSRPDDGSSISADANKDSSDKTDSSNNNTNNPLNEESFSSGTNSAVENDNTLASDVIKVPVNITKNPGVMAGMVVIEYDASVMTCVGYDNTDDIMQLLIEPQYSAGKVTAILEAPAIEDTNETGTLITLLFKAKKDAKAGSYEIKISDSTEFSNYNEQLVEPTLVAEKVTIK